MFVGFKMHLFFLSSNETMNFNATLHKITSQETLSIILLIGTFFIMLNGLGVLCGHLLNKHSRRRHR